ncbi:MAG TPA: phage/plasmid replication protein, partial [Allocoleopsis sp.]
PKLYYGHNIHLLYEYPKPLKLLKGLLERHFGFKGRGRLIDIGAWNLWRLDVCYAWKCPDQATAQQVLDSMKHLHFPRKKPHIYATGLLFSGTTYSLKFYLKLPEFKEHDRRVLLKAKCQLEFINYCEDIAKGVVRVEATLRRKFLLQRGIKTVSDLLTPKIEYEFSREDFPEETDLGDAVFAIIGYNLDQSDGFTDWEQVINDTEDGSVFNAPEGYETTIYRNEETINYKHTGKGFILRKTDQPTTILQFLLTKFLGDNPTMQHSEEVESKLNSAFKPVKAARLMAMWLYVQRYGTQKTKEAFGHDSYYNSKREMKKAGVSFIEPPKNVVRLQPKFYDQFRIEVPSQFATNRVDDFRDSANILNLPVNASS